MMLSPSPKDIPIIFSAPMIRALLDNRKTMTRRLAWRGNGKKGANYVAQAMHSPWRKVRPGDRLWVRETWQKHHSYATLEDAVRAGPLMGALYRATHGPNNLPLRWRSPIHMPRVHSRLTLIVTATKIERLQEITNEEAELEGVKCDMSIRTFREHFKILWCDLHGYDSWDANPEVVAISFFVHKANIDTLPKAEAA